MYSTYNKFYKRVYKGFHYIYTYYVFIQTFNTCIED